MRRTIYDYFLLLVLGFVLYAILKMLAPFAGALLAALMCAVTFYPIHLALHRYFPRLNPSARAAITDLVVMVFFVVPILLLAWAVFQESASLLIILRAGSSAVAEWRAGNMIDSVPWLENVRFFLSKAFGVNHAAFRQRAISMLNDGVDYGSVLCATAARNALSSILDLLIMLFTLFFMIRDGHKLFNYFQDLVPIRQHNKDQIRKRVRDTLDGVARGLFLTSLLQGVLATLGYLIVGAEGYVLLGVLTAVVGLIPLIGTFGIWVPASVFFFFKGSYLKGIFLLSWGTLVVVGFTDTIVRPYLVGKRVELPVFVLFFALLGGAEVWGAKGILLGPILAAVAPMLLHMYREQFLRAPDSKPEESSTPQAL